MKQIEMPLRRAGKSGILLPAISLGLWQNFGSVDNQDEAEKMIIHAFDRGIIHFDLANNYGPEPGSAEENFGRIVAKNLKNHRDQMFISSKAGHEMWPGPYGDGSSRKNLIASINQSLKRTGLEYFDVFYSHRYDGVTPVEETMQALIDIVRQGKALYVGISKYPIDKQLEAYKILKEAKVPCLLSQYKYNLQERTKIESGILENAFANGSGFVAFSPLNQGLLTNKYLNGIPEESRAARKDGFLQINQVTPKLVEMSKQLNEIAIKRNQTLAQMSLAWLLSNQKLTSVIIGSRNCKQMDDSLDCLHNLEFSNEELAQIDKLTK